jgi:putative cell wall-binding protein
VAISRDRYPVAHTAKAVVLARGDAFPDALAGGPLAAHVAGPLLLTSTTGLDPATAAEIARVAAKGATVYLLGGPAALGTAVADAVSRLGDKPVRISGADRYATAVAVAKAEGSPGVVFEVTGLGFADALSGVPAAIAYHGAVLLTDGSTQAPETAAYLATLARTTRYALGGAAAAADTTATAVFGADRYATSAAIASMFFPAPSLVGIATGASFPDALGAGPDLGARGAPLVLVPRGVSTLPSVLQNYLGAVSGTVIGGDVFGGPDAVSADTVTAAQNALGLVG